MKALYCLTLLLLPTAAMAQASRYSTLPTQRIYNTTVPQDTRLLQQALEAKQGEYDRQVAICRQQTKEMYEGLSGPVVMLQGSRTATFVSESANVCTERVCFVSSEGFLTKARRSDGTDEEIAGSTRIANGKCMYKKPDPETGISNYFTVYFLEDLSRK